MTVFLGGLQTIDYYNDFRRDVELETKQDLPNTFGYINNEAFSWRRLLDLTILRLQHIPQL